MATLDTTRADSSEKGTREASLSSSFEQQFDEDHVESEDNIATGKPSSVIVSKPLLRAADAVKTMQRNLGYPSIDHIIRSRRNGSVSFEDFYPNSLIKATESILGKSPFAIKGTMKHGRHIPANAAKMVNPVGRQVLMQIDLLLDEKSTWLVSVIDRIGMVLIAQVAGKGEKDLNNPRKEMIKKFDVHVKVVEAGRENSFAKMAKDI